VGRNRRTPRPERGQILVVFVLAMVAIIGVVGLAIDGGGAYAQRRDQQTAADLAALAGANDYLLSNNATQATDRARTIAATNDFTNGASTSVGVTLDTTNGVEVLVTIRSPHANSFLGALGMASWTVTTSATALAGFPDTAGGAGPFIFSIGAFNNDGTPKYQTSTDFGETNGDVPTSELDMAWTNYGTGNVNTSEVSSIISGAEVVTKTLDYGEYIGQHNNGNHTALYGDVDTYLSGKEMPVAIVDASGNFMGWATFHVNSASGGSNKHINGYFLSSFASAQTTVTSCANNACPRYLGTYVLKLTN
jgi:Flp pilus assembly protein TadG